MWAFRMQELDEATAYELLASPFIRHKEAAQLPYLDACIKESARLDHNFAMALPRDIPAAGVVVAGQFIPD